NASNRPERGRPNTRLPNPWERENVDPIENQIFFESFENPPEELPENEDAFRVFNVSPTPGEFPMEALELWAEPTDEQFNPSSDEEGLEELRNSWVRRANEHINTLNGHLNPSLNERRGFEERTPSPVGQDWNPPLHVWPVNEREPLNDWSLTSVIKEKARKLHPKGEETIEETP
ncbi:hypothetical protein GPALN_010284, partial [Globodera pallida]